ncbi:MAG: response regulator [Armatimonas sp.]
MSTSGGFSKNTTTGQSVITDVLLVDDSPTDIEIARRYLERDGEGRFCVRACNTARGATEELKERIPDCILLDINLPDADATDWLSQLCQEYKELPCAVVALTGNSYSQTTVAVMKAGASDYLVKGRIDAELLRHTVLKAVESSRLKIALREEQQKTERQNQELQCIAEALQESERRFRGIFNATFQFIGLLNPEGDVLEMNETALNAMASRKEDLLRGKFWETPWWTPYPEVQEQVRQAVADAASGQFVRFEALYHRANGTEAVADFSLSPVRNEAGEVVLLVPEGRDISERVADRKNIEELNVRLQRAVAESNHRVKNNLQVLSALVELETSRGGGTMSTEAVQRIAQHVRSLAKLHDLLTWEARRSNSHEGHVSIQKALKEVLLSVEQAIGAKIEFYSDDAYIGAKAATSLLMAANEMLSNASKHGRGQIELRFTLEETPGESTKGKLMVSDNGPGFPENFNPDTAANTGLELIESLGRWDLEGTVKYSNLESGGACVTLEFPLVS